MEKSNDAKDNTSDDDGRSQVDRTSSSSDADLLAEATSHALGPLADVVRSTTDEQILSLAAKIAAANFGTKINDLRSPLSAVTTFDVGALMGRVLESQGSRLVSEITGSWPTLLMLSNPALFSDPEPPETPYSSHMKTISDFFSGYEAVIDSVPDLNRYITNLVRYSSGLQLVWRGQQSIEWGIHSSLFRALRDQNGVQAPDGNPQGDQPFPSENQMIASEEVILDAARSQWRFDGTSALETFARIQHAGGLTRLLDVTFNPYIAAWFATEEDDEHDMKDGRLIAFATTPMAKKGQPEPPPSRIELDLLWGGRQPLWHSFETSKERQKYDWGTGSRRRLWVPPAYDPRIAAQNAAFLLDGIPITSSKTAPYFHVQGERNMYFKRADLLAAGSMLMRTVSPQRRVQYNAQNMAPAFPFRISAAAKPIIRQHLEATFGYSRASLYPDMTALARYVSGIKLPSLT